MLDLAGQRWNYPGNLEQAVRDEFEISLTRFYQIVNRLIDTREALEYSPTVVNRLRRLRTRRH
ncbi:DUF3263 domain-containing protein [Gordonia amicalis]|uniref:DUF3263 domain-containing protein n=2 Tax=Gordoniaceae TaxID=85026 RepID=UPI0020C81798|nr:MULTISPECIES: DUF3263 domain-containing protein [Gordonia]MDJ0454689.1 DUF3263 domain-containing protein [Gordonia amicalis]MDV7077962.1 DUF3263 domain-containing protein [Gordonia amicalis]